MYAAEAALVSKGQGLTMRLDDLILTSATTSSSLSLPSAAPAASAAIDGATVLIDAFATGSGARPTLARALRHNSLTLAITGRSGDSDDDGNGFDGDDDTSYHGIASSADVMSQPPLLTPADRRRYTYAMVKAPGRCNSSGTSYQPITAEAGARSGRLARLRHSARLKQSSSSMQSSSSSTSSAHHKLWFLTCELAGDLIPPGQSLWHSAASALTSFPFWAQALLLAASFWTRAFAHYTCQYLLLRAWRVPVYDFSLTPFGCTLKYVARALPSSLEIGVIAAGPLGALLAFAVAAGFLSLLQSLLGPAVLSGALSPLCWYVLYLGIGSALDGPLIAAVDAAAGRYDCASRYPACVSDPAGSVCPCVEGDAWRLPRRFADEEGSAAMGIAVTSVAYILASGFSALLLWWYLLDVHLGGRIRDTYTRLHATELDEDSGGSWAVPDDCEVAPSEVQAAVDKAGRWRGPLGEIRRVAVVQQTVAEAFCHSNNSTTGWFSGTFSSSSIKAATKRMSLRTHILILNCEPPQQTKQPQSRSRAHRSSSSSGKISSTGGRFWSTTTTTPSAAAAMSEADVMPLMSTLTSGRPSSLHRHFVVLHDRGMIVELLVADGDASPATGHTSSKLRNNNVPASSSCSDSPWWGAADAVAQAIRGDSAPLVASPRPASAEAATAQLLQVAVPGPHVQEANSAVSDT